MNGKDHLKETWQIHLAAVVCYPTIILITDPLTLNKTVQAYMFLYGIAGIIFGMQIAILIEKDVIGKKSDSH